MRRILLGLACIVALAPIAQGATTPSLQSGGSAGSGTSGLKASDLLAKIDKALARLPKPSAYLSETNSVPGKVTSTWTEMTAGILGTRDLRVAYDNFYQTSVDYSGMVAVNLLRAKRAAQNNEVEAANRLYQAALRYESQFYLNDKAAIEAFNGNIDAVTVLTKGIYQGSKAAVIYGSSMVMGPVGSRVVDTVFSATDFAVEYSDSGLASATKKLVADKLTEMIFSQATVATLGGKTMKDALERGVTTTLGNPEVYKVVREVVSKPEFAKAFMNFMAKSGAYAASGVTEAQINKIVMSIVEAGASKLPLLTDCGPNSKEKEYLRWLLQTGEVLQATGGGYSFNTACQSHDTCYGDCKTGKPECDKKLLEDAKLVCDSSYFKADCLGAAQIFYWAVSNWADAAFSSARANCPASSTQVIKTTVPPKNNADDIRHVDFLNFSYRPTLCHSEYAKEGIGKVMQIRNGKFANGRIDYGVVENKVIYGELTGDNGQEAVVHTNCWLKGANFGLSEIQIFTLRDGQPLLLANINDNDRQRDYRRYHPNGNLWFGLTGIGAAVKIIGGNLIIEQLADGPHCCPENIVTFTYLWNGKQFVLNKPPQKRPFNNDEAQRSRASPASTGASSGTATALNTAQPPGRLVYETCFQMECFKQYLVSSSLNNDGVVVARVATSFHFNEAGYSKKLYNDEYVRLRSLPVKYSAYKVSCNTPGGYIQSDDGSRTPQPERNVSHATEGAFKMWSAVCERSASGAIFGESECRINLRPQSPTTFIGRFSNLHHTAEHAYGYNVELYRSADCLFGEFNAAVGPQADFPTGLIESVTYDERTRAISFIARLSLGEFSGQPTRDVYKFTGTLERSALRGKLVLESKDRPAGTNTPSSPENVVLRRVQDEYGRESLRTFAQWQSAMAPILKFRGPKW